MYMCVKHKKLAYFSQMGDKQWIPWGRFMFFGSSIYTKALQKHQKIEDQYRMTKKSGQTKGMG